MSDFKRFRFGSPGSKIAEIDNTYLENTAGDIGPLIIGRAKKGPFYPVTLSSQKDLVDVYGIPEPGIRGAGDVWRNGDVLAPMYGLYAAHAYLASQDTVTFLRLAGEEHPSRETGMGEAGWVTDLTSYEPATPVVGLGDVFATAPGLDDATFTGTYIGSRTGVFTVVLTVVAGLAVDPNTFSVTIAGGAPSAPVNMEAGVPIEIMDGTEHTGIYVTFVAQVGHTVGNTWTLTSTMPATSDDGGAYGLFVTHLTPIMNLESIAHVGAVGPDDAVFTGVYDGAEIGFVEIKLTIVADGVTDPNTYTVTVNGGAPSAAKDMSTSPVEVVDGIYVTWGATTGHTAAETYAISSDPLTMVHAATLYVNDGALSLEGDDLSGTPAVGNAAFIQSVGNNFEFTARVHAAAGAVGTYEKKLKFNFDDRSTHYIRKVFSTNPTLTNNAITATGSRVNYWLGESFRSSLFSQLPASVSGYAGCFLKLQNATSNAADHQFGMQEAKTGWVFGQDLSSDGHGTYTGTPGNLVSTPGAYDADTMPKLFRFHALDGGSWLQGNVKVSIDKIRYSNTRNTDYGMFDVVVRSASDTDKNPIVLETFANCSLDPASPNFISKKVGDMRVVWNETEERYKVYGNNENNSKYIRVEVSTDVENGSAEPSLLPWGFYGETVLADMLKSNVGAFDITFSGVEWVRGSLLGSSATEWIAFGVSAADDEIDTAAVEMYPNIVEAILRLRETFTEEDVSKASNVFWGVRTTAYDVNKYDSDFPDYVRCNSAMHIGKTGDDSGYKYAYKFTLDDICYEEMSATPYDYSLTTRALYMDGAYKAGRSITAGYKLLNTGLLDATVEADYKNLIDLNYARFTMAFSGGFDGFNIREKDYFRNTLLTNITSVEEDRESYVLYSLLKALNVAANKERMEFDTISIPGITNPVVNRRILDVAKERKDCIADIDIAGQYIPSHENYDSEEDRVGSVSEYILEKQAFDTDKNDSYGCTYFNWTKIADPNNRTVKLWVPPSVVSLGAMAYSRKVGNIWDAPAGYNRANLSQGHSGLSVVDTMFELNEDERDTLYENQTNPIVRLNNEVVVMGQKTLQTVASYLDRINIRLLVNHIKRYVKFKQDRVLFDDIVFTVWNRFINEVDPFLRSIQVGGGLAKYEIIFDITTTTPDMIDRNEMYAKIKIWPSTVGEFFGVDLIINKSGVVFLDE